MWCPIYWLAECAIAQGAATAIAPPQTGNAGLDALVTAIYAAVGLGGLTLADKIGFWVLKARNRKNGNGGEHSDSIARLARASERVAEAVERVDARLDKIEDICTRLEDRSRFARAKE